MFTILKVQVVTGSSGYKTRLLSAYQILCNHRNKKFKRSIVETVGLQ